MIYKTPTGQTTLDLLDRDEFLRCDAAKETRKAGLYVTKRDHINETKMGMVLESIKPNSIKSVHPPDDETDFDFATVNLATGLVTMVFEFKGRKYPSTKRFPYGPEVQKARKMHVLAKKWGVRAFFIVRWTDGVVHHVEINDGFFAKYDNSQYVKPLFNAQPNRPGETPDDVIQLPPADFQSKLTKYAKAVFL